MTDDTFNGNYIDLEPDPLGDLKSISRLKSMRTNPPPIAFTQAYHEMPPAERLAYVEKLAATMNHAADVLQTERNELLERVARMERQLEHSAKVYLEQGELMHRKIGEIDQQKQEALRSLVRVQQALIEANTRIRALED